MKTLCRLVIVLVAVLSIGSQAHAAIDSLWSSPSTTGGKGGLTAPGSSRVDYLYVLDSAAAVCRIYDPDNFSQLYSCPLAAGTYTYLWYQYLDDVDGSGDPEAIVYRYSTSTYCYSVSIIDMSSGSVLKSWSSSTYSYFPKFVAATPGSGMLKLGIERSYDIAGGFPSTLLVYSLGIAVGVAATGTGEKSRTPGIELEQSFPNPAREQAVIEFTLPRAGRATVTIYNQLGQEVRTLVDKELPAGKHMARFDAAGLANGAYFYRLRTQDGQDTRRLLLVK